MKAFWNFIWRSTLFSFVWFVGAGILATFVYDEANDTMIAIFGLLIFLWTAVALMFAYKIGRSGRKENESVESVPQSPKSVYITFFLCLFLGIFGGHRFYVGKPVTAMLMLATAGGGFVWTFIDLVIILLGYFKDENGYFVRQNSIGLRVDTAELVNSEGLETLEEFLAELPDIEPPPLPADVQDEYADQIEEEEVVEQDNEQTAEEDAKDFIALISQFPKEEKFILMVGLLALYGDGELSPKEVYQFKKTIKALDFKPASLTHRDPSDQALCLNETLAWSLSFIRTNFADAANLSDEDVIEIFNALTTSIETDIKKAFPEKKQQLTYSIRLKKALTDIAKADGKLSKGEKKLIKKYDKTSNL
jgi:TM2 domain-containing membrane protein YozV